jgi:hypothetical protein
LLQFYRNCWYWESSPPMVWSFWRSVELAENNENWSFRPWHGILRCLRRFLHGGVSQMATGTSANHDFDMSWSSWLSTSASLMSLLGSETWETEHPAFVLG